MKGTAKRELPTDSRASFDAAIRKSKMMVTPLLHGVSKLGVELGGMLDVKVPPLDKDEIDQGGDAFGAYLYQYAHEFDPKVMIGMWLVGVTLPRALHVVGEMRRRNAKPTPELVAAKRRELQDLERQALMAPAPAPAEH